MKRLVAAVVAVAVVAPAMAISAPTFTANFKPGTYQGKATSVVPDLNGLPLEMTVVTKGNDVVATVTYQGGKEIWTWNDKTLLQQEIDPATGKVLKQYAATATAPANGTSQNYVINCADKKANSCDAGIDYRNNWTLKANPNGGIEYIVFGVDKDQRGNPNAPVKQRHDFAFNQTTAATK